MTEVTGITAHGLTISGPYVKAGEPVKCRTASNLIVVQSQETPSSR